MRHVIVLLPVLVGACGPGPAAAPPRPVVAAAASLTPVMETLAASYEAAGGGPVALNLAASSVLAAQILSDAPVDLFISADRFQMDRVRGRIEADTLVELLSNQLVVVAPAGSPVRVAAPGDLAATGIRRIAIGDPAGVPAGVYARDYLRSVGLWAALEDRMLPVQHVRAALATVAAGDADLGFVYRTDARSAAGVTTVYEVAVAEGPRIVYPAAVVAGGRAAAAARRFLAYLTGDDARAVFTEAGFIVPERR